MGVRDYGGGPLQRSNFEKVVKILSVNYLIVIYGKLLDRQYIQII